MAAKWLFMTSPEWNLRAPSNAAAVQLMTYASCSEVLTDRRLAWREKFVSSVPSCFPILQCLRKVRFRQQYYHFI